MKKKRSRIGCLFWLALVLLVIVIFLLNRPTIERVIQSTGFLNIFKKEQPQEKPEVIRDKETEPAVDTKKPEEQKKPEPPAEKQPIVEEQKPKPDKQPEIVIDTVPEKETPIREKEKEPQSKLSRKAQLFFVMVDDEGRIHLKGTMRTVYYTDSPLRDTLSALMEGPDQEELNKGLISLIPKGTKLLGASVKDDTVSLNFNETFRFNPLGIEGYRGQLKQIIYTATEFSNVKKVQILIDGRQHKYLGAEGIYIENPLTRDSVY